MEMDSQPNGPRRETRTGRNRNTLANKISKQLTGPESSSLQSGTWRESPDRQKALASLSSGQKKTKEFDDRLRRLAANVQAPTSGQVAMPQANNNMAQLAAIMSTAQQVAGNQQSAGLQAKVPGGIKKQLMQGFRDAGRPDLAKMVRTSAFDTWIGQESGWRPGAVSPTNNQGQANGGLFQFWYGHDFSNSAEGKNRFKASPYQQAIWAAKNFTLTPERIKEFAQQIRAGTYGGWG